MIVTAALRHKHDNAMPYIKEVEDRVRSVVIQFCREHGYAFVDRVKT